MERRLVVFGQVSPTGSSLAPQFQAPQFVSRAGPTLTELLTLMSKLPGDPIQIIFWTFLNNYQDSQAFKKVIILKRFKTRASKYIHCIIVFFDTFFLSDLASAMASPESSEFGDEEPQVPPLQAIQTLRADFATWIWWLRYTGDQNPLPGRGPLEKRRFKWYPNEDVFGIGVVPTIFWYVLPYLQWGL